MVMHVLLLSCIENVVILCVWTDICTLYIFYVSEINIYLSIYVMGMSDFLAKW